MPRDIPSKHPGEYVLNTLAGFIICALNSP
jgi:hypothetical protein